MRFIRRVAWILVAAPCSLAEPSHAPPDATRGRERLAELGCAACHGELRPAGHRVGPDLTLSLAREAPAALREFLSAPHTAQPGTRMPDVLGGLGGAARADAIDALLVFLVSEAGTEAQTGVAGEARVGERLYHEIGCVHCHGPRGERAAVEASARTLDHVAAKYTQVGLAAFLLDPLEHRPAGLMPDMHLTRQEALSLSAYLGPRNASPDVAPAALDPAQVARGRELFGELRCANCHVGIGGVEARAAERLARDLDAGCLAEEPPAGAARYGFSSGERATLRAAVEDIGRVLTPEEHVAGTLDALRCTACHVRDGAGGVPPSLDEFLRTDEPDLGEYGSRPPSLDGVGGKLRREWLERVVLDGASVRPYMRTRMPVFGAANVAHLPGLLEQLDAAEPLTFPKLAGDPEREAREAAKRMLGTSGLACVSCHRFNAQDGPGFQGLDLLTTPERLRERWFRDFLVAPTSKLPDIVMPEAWPGGEPVLTSLLDGDTDRQIGALWHFLALGRSAQNPKGIAAPRWNIDVEGAPRVYRGRSRIAGFRGIAAGFPEALHYAFDAQNGALAAIWRGDFVSVNWNGQGAGDFNPRARAAELPRDVAFLAGESTDGWPLAPVKTEEEPVNPDPTYPRQHGYRFRGYRLDDAGVPTLRYSLHDVAIEDRCVPIQRQPAGEAPTVGLLRTLTFDVPAGSSVDAMQLRLLAGPIEALGEDRFRSGRVTLTVSGGSLAFRTMTEQDDLRITLQPAAGRSTLELIYDLVD